ncbi:methyltransferase [Verrucomicrobia bacterium LW23]|nr:methyltransferase [Verrucomicrobia bacterium LW23]
MSSSVAPRMVNLGCGGRFHPAWENYDLTPASPDVRPLDLSGPLPFEDASVDVIYASHVVEHLDRSAVPALLSDIRRVLRPEGILRLVVPDLEGIVRGYLRCLDKARRKPRQLALAEHEWMTLELLDQIIRSRGGGYMGRLWQSTPFLAKPLVARRFGREFTDWDAAFGPRDGQGPIARHEVYQIPPASNEERVAFLATGENHRWMYDEISLGALMRQAGFASPRAVRANQSQIPHFAGYQLDTDEHGAVRKPDSLFMEAGGKAQHSTRVGKLLQRLRRLLPF